MKKLKTEGDLPHSATNKKHRNHTRKGKKHKLSPREYWERRWKNAKTDEEKIEVWMERNNRGSAAERQDAPTIPSMQGDLSFVAAESEKIKMIVSNPESFYTERFIGAAKKYHKAFNHRRYRVATLAQDASKILDFNIMEIFIDGKKLSATSWPECLSHVLGMFAREREADMKFLAKTGLLGWIKADNPEAGLLDALRSGECTATFKTMLGVCRRLQWLLLMCGIPLNRVAVLHNVYTDDEWQRLLECEAKTKAKPEAKVRGISHPRPQSPNSSHISHGTYIVENGLVVFLSSMQECENDDGRIMRSDSDSEDTWKGYGFIARDGGRFGGINGEDFPE